MIRNRITLKFGSGSVISFMRCTIILKIITPLFYLWLTILRRRIVERLYIRKISIILSILILILILTLISIFIFFFIVFVFYAHWINVLLITLCYIFFIIVKNTLIRSRLWNIIIFICNIQNLIFLTVITFNLYICSKFSLFIFNGQLILIDFYMHLMIIIVLIKLIIILIILQKLPLELIFAQIFFLRAIWTWFPVIIIILFYFIFLLLIHLLKDKWSWLKRNIFIISITL